MRGAGAAAEGTRIPLLAPGRAGAGSVCVCVEGGCPVSARPAAGRDLGPAVSVGDKVPERRDGADIAPSAPRGEGGAGAPERCRAGAAPAPLLGRLGAAGQQSPRAAPRPPPAAVPANPFPGRI